jgi:hypothetical protein
MAARVLKQFRQNHLAVLGEDRSKQFQQRNSASKRRERSEQERKQWNDRCNRIVGNAGPHEWDVLITGRLNDLASGHETTHRCLGRVPVMVTVIDS